MKHTLEETMSSDELKNLYQDAMHGIMLGSRILCDLGASNKGIELILQASDEFSKQLGQLRKQTECKIIVAKLLEDIKNGKK